MQPLAQGQDTGERSALIATLALIGTPSLLSRPFTAVISYTTLSLIHGQVANSLMALLFVKSLLLPTNNMDKARYSPLASRADVERGTSSESSRTAHDEKNTATDSTVSRSRINARIIADATIGLSDGLTVPFALTAGLSALGDAHVVIYGGLAELIAGGISMGLGGYLGAKSEAEGYQAALSETRVIVGKDRVKAERMVKDAFESFDLPEAALHAVATNLAEKPDEMVGFLMKFSHQLAEADYAPSRAYISGLTISAGYFFGGLVPLLPYLFFTSVQSAFVGSVVVMMIALFAFGWIKTALVGESDRWVCLKNAVQMVVMGGVAAGAAMGCVKAVGGSG